jgi:arylsulfatase A-like enzyme
MPSPNILFITTDQQRWDAVGIHNPVLRTPNMDRLANEGIRFDRTYPTNAICMPSRASMITGRSQRGHQVFNHNVNLSEAIPVLGDSLREAGYQTALIGKAHFKTADIEDVLPDEPPPGTNVDPDDGL